MKAFRLCVVMVMVELFSLAVVGVARQRVIDDSSQGILGTILNHVPLLSGSIYQNNVSPSPLVCSGQ